MEQKFFFSKGVPPTKKKTTFFFFWLKRRPLDGASVEKSGKISSKFFRILLPTSATRWRWRRAKTGENASKNAVRACREGVAEIRQNDANMWAEKAKLLRWWSCAAAERRPRLQPRIRPRMIQKWRENRQNDAILCVLWGPEKAVPWGQNYFAAQCCATAENDAEPRKLSKWRKNVGQEWRKNDFLRKNSIAIAALRRLTRFEMKNSKPIANWLYLLGLNDAVNLKQSSSGSRSQLWAQN